MSHDPTAVLSDAWSRLRAGQADGHHPFRTAALATADALGRPDARTVVLRRVDEPARTIDFQTDRRSPKFHGLRHNAAATWLFYDADEQLQLRVRTSVTAHAADAVAAAEWARVPEAARRPYRSVLAPGAAADAPADPTPSPDTDGYAHFVVARCTVESLEWLKREAETWRRLRFAWPGGRAAWTWLAP